jgi:hypothetical protein
MFGTIGHARPKPGSETKFMDLMDEWRKTIRPKVPGSFLAMGGTPKDRPGEIVFIALAQDEATYRQLAAMPEQDAFFHQMMEFLEAEPTWEDVEMEISVKDI